MKLTLENLTFAAVLITAAVIALFGAYFVSQNPFIY